MKEPMCAFWAEIVTERWRSADIAQRWPEPTASYWVFTNSSGGLWCVNPQCRGSRHAQDKKMCQQETRNQAGIQMHRQYSQRRQYLGSRTTFPLLHFLELAFIKAWLNRVNFSWSLSLCCFSSGLFSFLTHSLRTEFQTEYAWVGGRSIWFVGVTCHHCVALCLILRCGYLGCGCQTPSGSTSWLFFSVLLANTGKFRISHCCGASGAWLLRALSACYH